MSPRTFSLSREISSRGEHFSLTFESLGVKINANLQEGPNSHEDDDCN